MNIEEAVSAVCPPGGRVTWSLQWSRLHPMFLAGKCPGRSVTPGLRGQSPGLGPVVTTAWPHPGARCQYKWSSQGASTPECASRGARALSLPGHLPERVSWRSACHRSVTLRDWVRDSCVTSHDSVTSHHCYCHHYLCLLCHSCCQGSLPISELVLS